MKIERGKFYKTREGQKVGPIEENVSLGASAASYWVSSFAGVPFSWCFDGKYFQGREDPLDLIAEWTDEPTFDPLDPPAFGKLTDEQKGELLLHAHNGGEIEMMNCGKWAFVHPAFAEGERYRKKPETKRETVTMKGYINAAKGFICGSNRIAKFDTHRITFDTIDGKPVCDSIKIEEL